MEYPKLTKAFIRGLKEKHNMEYDDVKTWIFCGGQANPNVDNTPDEFMAYENYFRLCFPNKPFPDIDNKCVCDVNLVHNCYMRKDVNSPVDDILIIGSCCIKKFIEAGKVRKCYKCNADHKNRKYNLCNGCKVDEIDKEKQAKKDMAKYNRVVCFDIPYEIGQENISNGILYYTKWNSEFKIRTIKDSKQHSYIIKHFEKYRIDDIKDFIEKRKNKHVEYKTIEYSKEAIADAKKHGLKFDGIKKLWYKQY